MGIRESNTGKGKLWESASTLQVPCFPLESILLAINRSHVDYFSLDVEGFELEVLKSIPFGRIQIDTLSVEYIHGGHRANKTYRQFMEDKGYTTHTELHYADAAKDLWVEDLIFANRSSPGGLN